jgi:uncharacterized protein
MTITIEDNKLADQGQQGLKVIDTDTHFSEPWDLWTSRVPAKYRELVPHVVRDSDGQAAWLVNGDTVFAKPAGASSVVRRDNTKMSFWEFNVMAGMEIGEVSEACYDPVERVKLMNSQGIWAQIMYPNTAGFGAHKLIDIPDRALSSMIVSVYNDAVAEFQERSGDRIFPQALIPFWDLDAAVKEVERAAKELKLRGITMCSEPHAGGLPDLPHRHWDPLWEACTEFEMPINLHVGASEYGIDAFLKGVWPSLDARRKHVTGAVQIELHNGRIMTNLLCSDLLPRFPKTKWVSVESGIGWLTYVFERLEYQLLEAAADGQGLDQPSPKELFQRQVYACFWFEDIGPRLQLEEIGFDNVLFETDFPHTTCLYPGGVRHGMEVLKGWGPEVQRKVMQDNAAKLYRIPV